MKKSILIFILLFVANSAIFSQQRMRLSKGSFKLSKSITKIPANCIDRVADIPEAYNVFEISTNSILLIGKSVPQIGVQEAIERGIIEITGNGTSTGVNINLLKPESGYDEIIVKNSSGVLGFKGQNFEDLSKLTTLNSEIKLIDEKYSDLISKYTADHPVTKYLEDKKYSIDGLFTKSEVSLEEIKTKINEAVNTTKLFENNYNYYSNHRGFNDYNKYLSEKYLEDNILTKHFRKNKYEIEESLKVETKEQITKKIGKLVKDIKQKEKVFDELSPDEYVFLDRHTRWNYDVLKGKNIIIERPNNLSKGDIKHILKFNKNPFVFSQKALFDNYNKPKEKLKFIVVGSEKIGKNIDLYGQENMQSFTNHVKDIKSNKDLNEYFEFVDSKESLEKSLEKNKGYRTITLYHNEGDELFGESKSIFNMQDRLTCNSFKEGNWGNTLESLYFIDPEDVINAFANLIKDNPNKNEFQILDFYEKFSQVYKNIRKERGIENKLKAGSFIIAVTGTGITILWVPTGNISGKIKSESSVKLDSIQVSLLDSNGRIQETIKISNGSFLFEDVIVSQYYLHIEEGLQIIDARDETPEDSKDSETIYGKFIYVNLEPKESDRDNNFKIIKN